MGKLKSDIKIFAVTPSVAFGGAEKIYLSIINGLKKQGFHCEAVTPVSQSNELLRKELHKLGIPRLRWPSTPTAQLRKPFSFLWGIFLWLKLLISNKPNAAYLIAPWPGQSLDFLVAAALLKLPILMVHQLVPPNVVFGKQTRVIYQWMSNRGLKLSTVSQSNAQILATALEIDRSQVTVIENGVPCKHDSADLPETNNFRQQYGIPKAATVIISVGRISQQKGYDLIPPAAHHIVKERNDVFFVWIGDGEKRDELDSMIAGYALENRFIITGWLENTHNAMESGDLFLLPSRYEGLPLVAMEAMAMGLPILAANASGITDLIQDHENGVLFRNNDTCDLLEKLRWALLNSKEMKAFSSRAQLRQITRNEETMINSTIISLFDLARDH